MNKPREWSIKPETGHIYPMDPSQSTAGCQVIEKSAYEALQAKLLEAEEIVANALYIGSLDADQMLRLQQKAEEYFK